MIYVIIIKSNMVKKIDDKKYESVFSYFLQRTMPVQTRSMKHKMIDTIIKSIPIALDVKSSPCPLPKYSVEMGVEIDFDEASSVWRKNKIAKGNGTFIYRKETRKHH